ncbi:MAG: large conductance mechanosensitive channel protein MscL [Lachnospiraceae bacterium]|nr:large conductance mechanosensitive channel protein MscL [Lachnospiraceae bacterium]
MKNFVKEFKEFISRGSVMDLAVGVIIGGAFQSIINSLVNDIIMPIITLLTGGIDFSNWFIALDGSHYTTLKAAQDAGASTLNYGVFITAVINFLLMAVVIFSIIKAMNKFTAAATAKLKKEEEEAKEETPEPSAEEKLLTEIRDLLKDKK